MTCKSIVESIQAVVPRRIRSPHSWIGHIPFAHWLVEHLKPATIVELGTHSGNSYFSFCQAVSHLGLDSKCYAIDHWLGDEHAGEYSQAVYDDVAEHNAQRYEAFSTLLRCSFDEAIPQFSDSSINLLHIDGGHTYEAVQHDFETWHPKLAQNALVLFHDTRVTREDFGVFRFWREVSGGQPHFEFQHSSGLGVLGIGTDFPPLVKELFSLGQSHRESQELSRYCELVAQVMNHRSALEYPPSPFHTVQLFADADGRFLERKSIRVDVREEAPSVCFDLEALPGDACMLRLDPGDRPCILRLRSVLGDGQPLKLRRSNAFRQFHDLLFFSTPDPQIIFDVDKKPSTVTVQVEFLGRESQVAKLKT